MLAKRAAPAPAARRCGGWSPPASRWTRRRSPPSATRPGSSPPTATARPRPARSPATSPASRCAGLDGQAAARASRPASPTPEPRRGVGELQLRAASSPTFFTRYLDGERFEGEWWPTGDLVRADADGYLFFEGRDDDIILSSGYRIGPFEVESALQSHPAVAEAAAVAAPDPERGAVVRAIVVPREREPSEELARELQEHCKRDDRALQVPPHRRVRRRAAEDEQRQDQARAAAPGVTWPDGHQRRDRCRERRPRLLRGGRPARPRRDDRVLRARRRRRDLRPGPPRVPDQLPRLVRRPLPRLPRLRDGDRRDRRRGRESGGALARHRQLQRQRPASKAWSPTAPASTSRAATS